MKCLLPGRLDICKFYPFKSGLSFELSFDGVTESTVVIHVLMTLCCDYIKKYIGFLYFYRPINIILSADWSDYIKDIPRRFPKSVPKFCNRPIVGRRSADTSADDKWRATIGRSSADDRPTVGR